MLASDNCATSVINGSIETTPFAITELENVFVPDPESVRLLNAGLANGII